MEEDVSLFEKEAFASGKDPEELMQIRKTERENASMRQQLEAQRQAQKEAEMRQNVNRQVQEWEQQAEEAKKVYPGLNLATEMQNTAFQTLLRNGFNVKNAYEALHTQEILQAGMAYASQKGAQAVTDNIIAGKGRPSENGTSAQGAMATRLDPATMTRKQRQDLIARAGRGERITL